MLVNLTTYQQLLGYLTLDTSLIGKKSQAINRYIHNLVLFHIGDKKLVTCLVCNSVKNLVTCLVKKKRKKLNINLQGSMRVVIPFCGVCLTSLQSIHLVYSEPTDRAIC